MQSQNSQSSIQAPAAFARALLDDLREPPDDPDGAPTDPEQIAYEAKLDAAVAQWIRELDGPGDRTLVLGNGREWFEEYMAECMLEGLTSQLYGGSTSERRTVVAALAGWVEVMRQLEEKAR